MLLIFGRLSAENELIALRSNGISVPRVTVPVFILSILCVGVCFWINVDVAPKAQQNMKAALFKIATSNPIAMFGSDQIITDFPGYLIYLEKKTGTQLQNILMYQVNDRGELQMVVRAKSGDLSTELGGDPQILLHLKGAQYEQRDAKKPDDVMLIQEGITSTDSTFVISLEELYQRNVHNGGLSTKMLAELLDLLKEPGGKMDPQQASDLRTEINKRFSLSLASFAFCLIGVPLAITAHRKETSVGFLFSLIVAFVYFFFIVMVGTVRGNPKFHPELLIWMPNIIFISLGAYLYYRMSRR